MSQEELSAPKRIIVCVDGSDISFRAADFAVALAEKLQSKIIFVNVVGASTSEKSYSITADMVGSFQRLGMEALVKCKEKAEKRDVRFETMQLAGDPADEIMKAARDTSCDCIVMGKKGLGRLEKLLLGSVSEKVVKLSDIPVTVVK